MAGIGNANANGNANVNANVNVNVSSFDAEKRLNLALNGRQSPQSLFVSTIHNRCYVHQLQTLHQVSTRDLSLPPKEIETFSYAKALNLHPWVGMVNLVSISLFFLSSCLTVLSPTTARSETRKATYAPLTEIDDLQPNQRNAIDSLLKASFSAAFMDSNNNKLRCSATFISANGHFITAAHCLNDCLTINNSFKPQEELSDTFESGLKVRNFALKAPHGEIYYQNTSFVDPVTGEHISYRRYYPEVTPLYCRLQINGKPEIAQLLVMGSGELHPYHSNEPLFERMKSEALRHSFIAFESEGAGWPTGDYGILKILSGEKTNCVQLGNRQARTGEKLRTVTYTLKASRNNPNNRVLGMVPFYAEGTLATFEMLQSKDGLSRTQMTRPNSIVTNIDADTGSSGGSIIGSDGTVLGIFSLVKDPSDKWGPRMKLSILSSVVGIQQKVRQSLDREIICRAP